MENKPYIERRRMGQGIDDNIYAPVMSNGEFLYSCIHTVFKRKLMILSIAVVTFIGVLFGTFLIEPVWKASAKIYVQTNPKQQLAIFQDLATPAEPIRNIYPANNMVQILTSRSMAEDIVRLFNRDERLKQKKEDPQTTRDKVLAFLKNTFIEKPTNFLIYFGILKDQPDNYLADAVEELRDDLEDIKLEEDTEVINVGLYGESPEIATNMANTMVQLFINKNVELARVPAGTAYNFTKEQMAKVEKELFESQNLLMRFKEENGIIQLDEEKTIKIQRLDEFEAELSNISFRMEETKERIRETKNQLSSQGERIKSSIVVADNPLVTELKATLQGQEAKLASLVIEKREDHPDVMRMKAEIEANKSRLKNELERKVQSETETSNPVYQNLIGKLVDLEVDRVGYLAKQDVLKEKISGLKTALISMPSQEIELIRLSNTVDVKQSIYNELKKKMDELRVLKETTISDVDIKLTDPAKVYDYVRPDWPKWLLIIPAGFVGSLLLAVFTAFFVEYWDSSFSTAKEVEKSLALPVLGSLYKMKEIAFPFIGKRDNSVRDASHLPILYRQKNKEFVVSRINNDSMGATSYNRVVNKIFLNREAERDKIFLVTSPDRGNGKTVTSINLAMTLASRGRRVLLIEVDLRHPAIDRILKMDSYPGLVDYINGKGELKDVVKSNNGFHVITAGNIKELNVDPFETLASEKMKELLAESSQNFDAVVIDSPAIKESADPLHLSTLVDGVILVIEANKTPKRTILMAVERIEWVKGRFKGIILNRQENPIPKFIQDLIYI